MDCLSMSWHPLFFMVQCMTFMTSYTTINDNYEFEVFYAGQLGWSIVKSRICYPLFRLIIWERLARSDSLDWYKRRFQQFVPWKGQSKHRAKLIFTSYCARELIPLLFESSQWEQSNSVAGKHNTRISLCLA